MLKIIKLKISRRILRYMKDIIRKLKEQKFITKVGVSEDNYKDYITQTGDPDEIIKYVESKYEPIEAKLLNLSVGRGETTQAKMETDNDKIFQVSETILVPEVKVTNREGKEESLILYVVSVSSEGIQVVSVNNYDADTQKMVIPEVPAGAKLIRMGKNAYYPL